MYAPLLPAASKQRRTAARVCAGVQFVGLRATVARDGDSDDGVASLNAVHVGGATRVADQAIEAHLPTGTTFHDVFGEFMRPPYFPITPSQLAARKV